MAKLNIVRDVSGVPTYIAPVADVTYTANVAFSTEITVPAAPVGAQYAVLYVSNLNVRASLNEAIPAAGAAFVVSPGTVARNGFPVTEGDVIHVRNESASAGAIVSVEFFGGDA